MNAELYTRVFTSDRESWLNQRAKGIGASESAVLFQANPYMTAYKLYHLKKGNIEPDPETTRMLKGKIFEGAVLEVWSKLFGGCYSHNNTNILYVNKENPFLMCTPDAIITTAFGETMFAEVKCTDAYTKWRVQNNKIVDIPLEILVQLQHQMLVTGEESIMLIVMFFGEIYQETMYRNDKFIEELKKRIDTFKHCLDNDIEPKVCAEDTDVLKMLYPNLKKNHTVILPQKALLWDQEIQDLTKEIKGFNDLLKPLENKRKEYQNMIRHVMKDASIGIMPDGSKYILSESRRGGKYSKVSRTRTLKKIKQEIPNNGI